MIQLTFGVTDISGDLEDSSGQENGGILPKREALEPGIIAWHGDRPCDAKPAHERKTIKTLQITDHGGVSEDRRMQCTRSCHDLLTVAPHDSGGAMSGSRRLQSTRRERRSAVV